MRVCHVIGSIDPANGGPSTVIGRVASAQAALDAAVHVIGSCASDRVGVTREAISRVPGIERVDLTLLTPPASRLARLRAAHYTGAFEALPRPDIVHLHGVWDAPLVRVSARCRARSIPYLVRPAGMLDYWSLSQKAWKKKLALALVHRRMLRGAAVIHALNEHERDAIASLRLGTRIEIIPNGLFLQDIEIATAPGQFRAAHPALGDAPFVLFLSRLHFKKGLDILADAWKQLAPRHPGARLVVAGPREDDSLDHFTKGIADAGLTPTVLVVGPIYGPDKAAAFRECACFVLPSRQEGFSLAITEALGYGAPAVVTRDCHFPEVTEVGAGIETALNPTEVADAVSRMLSDPALRDACGSAGQRLIRERFTWPAVARRTLEVYRTLVPPAPPTHRDAPALSR